MAHLSYGNRPLARCPNQPCCGRGSFNKSRYDAERVGAISNDRVKYGISALGPDERLWVLIMGVDQGGDVGLEFIDAASDTALDLLAGEQRETSARCGLATILFRSGRRPQYARYTMSYQVQHFVMYTLK